jgi:hypothetical protein
MRVKMDKEPQQQSVMKYPSSVPAMNSSRMEPVTAPDSPPITMVMAPVVSSPSCVVSSSPCSAPSLSPRSNNLSPSAPTFVPASPPNNSVSIRDSTFALRICSSYEHLWYAERPFPAFSVEIAETGSQQRVTGISGWKVL